MGNIFIGMRRSPATYFAALKTLWLNLNGDAAYQRYLQHWYEHHQAEEQQPLGRKAFFAAEMQRKWGGINRCC